MECMNVHGANHPESHANRRVLAVRMVNMPDKARVAAHGTSAGGPMRISTRHHLPAFFVLFAACSGSDSSHLNASVDSVIIVGTSVTKEIYQTGHYGLTLVPKDDQGEVVLGQGLKVLITLASPSGFTSTIDDTTCNEGKAGDGLSVGVIIDDSGSMSGSDPEVRRKDAALAFIDALDDGDEVLLTDYGATSDGSLRDLVCASDPANTSDCSAAAGGFTHDKVALRAATEGIVASGGTPLYESCVQMVPLVAARKGKQAMLLLSDGQPGSDAERTACFDAAEAAGIPIFTVGLGPASEVDASGSDAAVTVLRELATSTGGAYAAADAPKALTALFANVGTALAKGKCNSEAILNQYEKLTPGTRVRGTVEVGDNQATGSFEFVAPPR